MIFNLSAAIEVQLECHCGDNGKLAELGIQSDDTEYQPGIISVDAINYFYPDSDGGCRINAAGDELHVRETYDEIKKKIEDANKLRT